MKVELSQEAIGKAEEFVRSGAYPSIDAAIEAGLEALDCGACAEADPDDPEIEAQIDADIAAGRTRVVDAAYLRELRVAAEAIIDAKRVR